MIMERDNYKHASSEGDIVRLPSGIVGIVSHIDFHCGGNIKEVGVFPLTNWFFRLILTLLGRTSYYDDDINSLTLLTKAAH